MGEANGNGGYSKIINLISERQEIENLRRNFPKWFSRQGKVKGHKIKCEIRKVATITQQKGRKIPLHLQDAVEAEIDKLPKEGHIRKVDKISDEVFIQPVVVTVKKNKPVKIALDARALNNAILKEKFQMPNLDNLMEQLAGIINGGTEGKVLFTSLDMQYAYGQIELHPETARHCIFQIIGGRANGTYASNTLTRRLRPTTLKELKSLMGPLNQMNTFIPNQAKLCASLRPLFSKETEWKRESEHEKAFQEMKIEMQKITEIKHFKKNQPVRIICDASREGLGAVLQQETEESWRATLFASRFLTTFEQKYSIIELELLSIENFRNYLYGIQFEVISDHKAKQLY